MQSKLGNLNSFSSHGGKLIFYHGVMIPGFRRDTIDYYQRGGSQCERRRSVEPFVSYRRAWAMAAAEGDGWTPSIC